MHNKNFRAQTLWALKVQKMSLQLELSVSLLSCYPNHKTIPNLQGQKKGNFWLLFKFWQSTYSNLTIRKKKHLKWVYYFDLHKT